MSMFKSNFPVASNEFKLLNVSVNGLFNQYDYEMDFSKNNISILIGPNGTGKTTILELISFMFYPTVKSLEILLSTPFKSLSFSMNNGRSFSIEKKADDSLRYFDEDVIFSFFENDKKISSFSFEQVATEFKMSTANGFAFRRNMKEELLCSKYGVNESFIEKLETHIRIHTKDLLPDTDSFQFIRANRMDKLLVGRKTKSYPQRDTKDEIDPLTLVNKAIKELYSDYSKEYTSRLTTASAYLPRAYLSEDFEDISYTEFITRHNIYKEKIKNLTNVGLINFEGQGISGTYTELSQPFNLTVEEELFARKKDFLIPYLKVYEVTLGVFEGIYEQINMFIDIFNKRNSLTKKEMKCSTKGITIISNGNVIPLDRLSSGEKHDLLMFYELIFGTGEIIFIDEPEISLHIEWQTDFIERVIEICEMNNCQVIMTTHSPYIVNGHDELIAPKQVTENE